MQATTGDHLSAASGLRAWRGPTPPSAAAFASAVPPLRTSAAFASTMPPLRTGAAFASTMPPLRPRVASAAFTPWILGWALCEAVAIFGLILFVLTFRWGLFLPYWLVVLGAMLVQVPTLRSLEITLERRQS
jgi:F0F1-type ATP synthase membrane subunit c/vacuolar-type H+-ATPase subunit K